MEINEVEKAQEILEKAIFDSRYLVPLEQFDLMSRMEQELYFSDSVYMMKEPAYAEKLSCGIYMKPTKFKVFKQLTKTVLKQMQRGKLEDFILEFNE